MNIKIRELKNELKSIAENIRQLKIETKKYQRVNKGALGSVGFMLKKMQWEYRHKHIAYCLLRGRTMQQIEKKNREYNAPNAQYIQTIMEKYHEEAICAN